MTDIIISKFFTDTLLFSLLYISIHTLIFGNNRSPIEGFRAIKTKPQILLEVINILLLILVVYIILNAIQLIIVLSDPDYFTKLFIFMITPIVPFLLWTITITFFANGKYEQNSIEKKEI